MQKLEEGVKNPTTKEELEEAIKKYDKRSMDLVLTDGQLGIWYKILGNRYLDQQMYGKALECFQQALAYYPNNANLYYYVGVCATYMSNTCLDYDATGATSESAIKRINYLRLAESSFLTSLDIEPNYYKAMYSIGILYMFEFKEFDKAIPYLEKFLSTQVRDTIVMLSLAGAYALTGQSDKAVDLYDRIIELKSNSENVQKAMENKKKVLDNQYQ